jgi:hypothetical protein
MAAALAIASLQVSSANIIYRTCKLENGITVLHDGSCEELSRARRAALEQARLELERKASEEKTLKVAAEQERARQLEKERQQSQQALKDCLRFGRCRLNQYKYHLARVSRADVDQLFGAPVLSHNLRQSTYNYYRVNTEGRRAVLQLEVVNSQIAGVSLVW